MSTFGLDPNDYRTLQDLVFTPLKEQGFLVYVFGSRARNTHQKFSDIDLLLVPPQSFDKAKFLKIKENIEEARFPIKVDFVLEDDVASSYSEQIQKDKIAV